jgi:hypothetical protein
MEDQIIESSINIMLPVLTKAVVLAGHYSKKCNRNTMTGQDMSYALKYCVRTKVGETIGIEHPELFDESDSDESDVELVDEDDEPFTRYTGDDELMNAVNSATDTWDEWEPQNPTERMLKDAVDKNMY